MRVLRGNESTLYGAQWAEYYGLQIFLWWTHRPNKILL